MEEKEPEEITRVFKERTEKDGTQHLEEVGTTSPEPPKDVSLESPNEVKGSDSTD